ncbi:MAG: hypothetical protein CBC29_09885 [Methylococcaceae bacterium TMED69]|nr:MAG: hypothetical protein CBC29_09885 [Methylococcaceae bacterium TMED69]
MVLNVFGEPLEICCKSPITGYFRDGLCRTDTSDYGLHLTCALLTNEFLEFSKSQGNDLSTPRPEFGFEGLKEGDKWCICAGRWTEALEAGKAPKIYLSATHQKMLSMVQIEVLERYALDLE